MTVVPTSGQNDPRRVGPARDPSGVATPGWGCCVVSGSLGQVDGASYLGPHGADPVVAGSESCVTVLAGAVPPTGEDYGCSNVQVIPGVTS